MPLFLTVLSFSSFDKAEKHFLSIYQIHSHKWNVKSSHYSIYIPKYSEWLLSVAPLIDTFTARTKVRHQSNVTRMFHSFPHLARIAALWNILMGASLNRKIITYSNLATLRNYHSYTHIIFRPAPLSLFNHFKM